MGPEVQKLIYGEVVAGIQDRPAEAKGRTLGQLHGPAQPPATLKGKNY